MVELVEISSRGDGWYRSPSSLIVCRFTRPLNIYRISRQTKNTLFTRMTLNSFDTWNSKAKYSPLERAVGLWSLHICVDFTSKHYEGLRRLNPYIMYSTPDRWLVSLKVNFVINGQRAAGKRANWFWQLRPSHRLELLVCLQCWQKGKKFRLHWHSFVRVQIYNKYWLSINRTNTRSILNLSQRSG